MEVVIWSGAFISVLGLVGLIWCIVYVARARRTAGDDEVLRQKLRRALPMNLGALFLSVIGLMLVIVGIFMS